MKWYIWLGIAIAIITIVYFATKKKPASAAVVLADSSPVSQTKNTFNPFEIVKIS